jgi:hypothetical protein
MYDELKAENVNHSGRTSDEGRLRVRSVGMGANVGFSPIADGSPRCRELPVWAITGHRAPLPFAQ